MRQNPSTKNQVRSPTVQKSCNFNLHLLFGTFFSLGQTLIFTDSHLGKSGSTFLWKKYLNVKNTLWRECYQRCNIVEGETSNCIIAKSWRYHAVCKILVIWSCDQSCDWVTMESKIESYDLCQIVLKNYGLHFVTRRSKYVIFVFCITWDIERLLGILSVNCVGLCRFDFWPHRASAFIRPLHRSTWLHDFPYAAHSAWKRNKSAWVPDFP